MVKLHFDLYYQKIHDLLLKNHLMHHSNLILIKKKQNKKNSNFKFRK